MDKTTEAAIRKETSDLVELTQQTAYVLGVAETLQAIYVGVMSDNLQAACNDKTFKELVEGARNEAAVFNHESAIEDMNAQYENIKDAVTRCEDIFTRRTNSFITDYSEEIDALAALAVEVEDQNDLLHRLQELTGEVMAKLKLED